MQAYLKKKKGKSQNEFWGSVGAALHTVTMWPVLRKGATRLQVQAWQPDPLSWAPVEGDHFATTVC